MKKWISLLLVVSLLGCLLAGCQKKEGNQGGGKTEDNKTSDVRREGRCQQPGTICAEADVSGYCKIRGL